MPRTIKFHLDENCDPRIAVHGVDVTTSGEAGLLHAPDDKHWAFAGEQGRVIVTQDADFLRMASAVMETPGIAYYPSQARTIGQAIRHLLLIWEVYEPEEMRNRVEYI